MKFEDAVRAVFDELDSNSRIVDVEIHNTYADLFVRPNSKKHPYRVSLSYDEETGEVCYHCPYNTHEPYGFAMDVVKKMKED